MSAGLLYGLLGGVVGTVTPSTPEGPPPGVEEDPRPILDDPLAMAIRPNGKRLALLRVGPDKEHATIWSAIQDARSRHSALGRTPTRDERIDILIDPGVYEEPGTRTLVADSHVAFYAADGQRASVETHAGFEGSWPHFYIEGLRVMPDAPDRGKYGFHITAGGTSIMSRCWWRAAPGSGGSGAALGMDGVSGADTYIYDCALLLPEATTPGGASVNMHGSLDYLANPTEVLVYVKVTNPGGSIAYGALLDDAADEVWMIDCDAASGQVGGASVRLYGSGNTFDQSAFTEIRDDWPIPYGGVSPRWREQLGLLPA